MPPFRLPALFPSSHPGPAGVDRTAHRAHLATRVCCRYHGRSAQRAELYSRYWLLIKPDWPPPHPQRSHLHGCTMATFICRVQFLDDTDPFNSTNFPEPTRPPLYTFREDIPLINQLAGVHRLLKAPHKVGPPVVNNASSTSLVHSDYRIIIVIYSTIKNDKIIKKN